MQQICGGKYISEAVKEKRKDERGSCSRNQSRSKRRMQGVKLAD